MAIHIRWHGHSCFTLETGGYTVAVDPYVPGTGGYPPLSLSVNAWYASHGHGDHCAPGAVRIEPANGESPFAVRTVRSFHDDRGGAERGENRIRLFEADGVSVAHLGDLGHTLTEEQVREIGKCTAVLVPVGGHFTVGPGEALFVARQLQADVVIPMHYRFGAYGFDVIGPLSGFLALADRDVIEYPSGAIDLAGNTARQIAVLKFPGAEGPCGKNR